MKGLSLTLNNFVTLQTKDLLPCTGCEKHGVHSSEASYFVCGTSVSSCLLIRRTSNHLGHNSSAHFSGQAINRASSFSSFQLTQRTSIQLKVGHGILICPLDKCILIFFSCPVVVNVLNSFTLCSSLSGVNWYINATRTVVYLNGMLRNSVDGIIFESSSLFPTKSSGAKEI